MQDGMPLILKVEQRRWRCTNSECNYVSTDQFSFLNKYKHNTAVTDLMILNAFRDSRLSARQIADRYNVSDSYALKLFSMYVKMNRRQLGEAISVDEVYVNVPHVCKYALVIQDFITSEPIDLLPGRRAEVTEPYFSSIPINERRKVRYFISDMYRPYIGYIEKYFPNAISIVDSFHVVKFINGRLRSYMQQLTRKLNRQDRDEHQRREEALHMSLEFRHSREYRLMKNYKWIVLSNPENLPHDMHYHYDRTLEQYVDYYILEDLFFKVDPNLKTFRILKNKYISFNQKYWNDPNKAKPALNDLISEYRKSGYPLFRDIADTLDANSTSIINSFIVVEKYCKDGVHHSRLSNGPMECINRIAKDLKRNARGYRNFEHLRNRFLFSTRENARILGSPRPEEEYVVHTGKKRGPYKKRKPTHQ